MQQEHILPIGTLLNNGRYRIDRFINQGGFGITYQAIDLNPDNTLIIENRVVVKELFLAGCGRKDKTVMEQAIPKENFNNFKQRFLEEAQNLKKFKRPDIVKVFDYFEENNTAYYVMTYITGITLKELVDKQQDKRLIIDNALHYTKQILVAVGEIHKQGILHRDIKPENIMITPNDGVVLIDFGSARQYVEDIKVTQTVMISHGYAPPEQYSEKHNRGTYTDIYGIGATLYYCITGHKPTNALDRCQLGKTEDLIEHPQKYNKLISDKLNNIILKAIHLDTNIRYQNTREMLDDLDDKTVNIPQESKQSYQESKQINYNKILIFSLIILTIITILGITKCNDNTKFEKLIIKQQTKTIKDINNNIKSVKIETEQQTKTTKNINNDIKPIKGEPEQQTKTTKEPIDNYIKTAKGEPEQQTKTTKEPIDNYIKTVKGEPEQQTKSKENKENNIKPIKTEPEQQIKNAKTSIDYNKISGDMIYVGGGYFYMGSNLDEVNRDEDENKHKANVKNFYIGKNEVTFAQYDKFCELTGRHKPSDEGWGRDNRPVVNISWYDAVAFCEWLSNKTGKSYRLPTETEWEYACRAGTTTPFNTGNCLSTFQANYNGTQPQIGCSEGRYKKKTMPVSSFTPNTWGLYDMHGNVWEWCNDWYGDYSQNNNITSSTQKVIRGGAWYYFSQDCRSANRHSSNPSSIYGTLGFRLAMDIK